MIDATAAELRNWAGNLAYGASRVAQPASADEVRALLAEWRGNGDARPVRAVGTRHSFNRIAATEGLLVSTAALVAPPVIDREASTVRVGAGTRYGELATALQHEGFALANLASLPHISIGGAIATGTHGSGDRNRNLAAAVAGLELVTASGDLVRLGRGDEGFDGAVVSLGALGIVTSVTLDIEPSFQIAQHAYERLPFDALLEHFDEITSAGYSVSVFHTWRTPDVADQVWLKRRPERDAAAPASLFGATAATEGKHPLPGISAESCTQQLGVPGDWFDRLPHFRLDFTPSNGAELQTEYLVPRRNAVAALGALHGLSDRFAHLLQVNEVRTVAADELWLSSSYGTDAVGLHFTWLPRQAEVEAVLPEIEAALAPFGARPHWGKVFTDGVDLDAVYPRLGEFRALAQRFDPDGVFRNPFLSFL